MSDPWTAARARFGKLCPLVRLIDLVADEQHFVTIPCGEKFEELELDGMTFISPEPASEAERQAVIREYDDVWRARQ